MDWFWGVAAVAILALLAWLGFRIEPHWVSKDARRFLCNGQLMNHLGLPTARWRETRVIVQSNGDVVVDQKRFMRHNSSAWTLTAESPDPPRGRAVFLLRGHDPQGQTQLMALRLPVKSRAIEVLREALPGTKQPGPRTS
jgi:hypothetical protein